jgi:hypothetical protein
MGNGNSRNFVEIPDTEYTPCAILLKKMGYRLVVFGFKDIVTVKLTECQKHLCIPYYTEEERSLQIQKLANSISETVSTFLVSLLTQGITVVIATNYSSAENGNVVQEHDVLQHDDHHKKAGYIFQGKPLIHGMFQYHFGEDVSKFIHVEESKNMWSAIKSAGKKYHVRDSEMILIHQDPELIRKARKYNMGGILVDDHTLGFRL